MSDNAKVTIELTEKEALEIGMILSAELATGPTFVPTRERIEELLRTLQRALTRAQQEPEDLGSWCGECRSQSCVAPHGSLPKQPALFDAPKEAGE